MLTTIRVHKENDDDHTDLPNQYEVIKIEKIKNRKLWSRYLHRKKERNTRREL